MSGQPRLDATTATISRNAILFDGETLQQRAELLHIDTEYLGRLLQLPQDRTGIDPLGGQPNPDATSER